MIVRLTGEGAEEAHGPDTGLRAPVNANGSGSDRRPVPCQARLTVLAWTKEGARVPHDGGAAADLKGTNPVATPEVGSRPHPPLSG